jgi:hypothetical protein
MNVASPGASDTSPESACGEGLPRRCSSGSAWLTSVQGGSPLTAQPSIADDA